MYILVLMFKFSSILNWRDLARGVPIGIQSYLRQFQIPNGYSFVFNGHFSTIMYRFYIQD